VRRLVFLIHLSLCLWLFQSKIFAADQNQNLHPVATVKSEDLEALIQARLGLVEEFRNIRALADIFGIRVWLWGGAASAFAHYAKWDLMMMGGDQSFRSRDFLDYKLNHILPADADIDLVVDGSSDKFEIFIATIKSLYIPQRELQWASLNANNSKKVQISSRAYQEQSSDTHSLGMIELSPPPQGESCVRYAKDWESKSGGKFLEDVSAGQIEFLQQETHLNTPRAQGGFNPEMLAVIRYLIKAFQFDLKITDASYERIKNIILSSLIDRKPPSGYVSGWVQKNARKLFTRSINMNRSHRVLSDLDLVSRISLLLSSEDRQLLRREALKSWPIGLGKGKTAEELGIKTVAHRSPSLENIEKMRSHPRTTPILLKSRIDAHGERAVFGEGFYVLVGENGDPNAGAYNIVFELDPNAREGSDFEVIENYSVGKALRILNAAALRIVDQTFVLQEGAALASQNQAQTNSTGLLFRQAFGLPLKPILSFHNTLQRTIGRKATRAAYISVASLYLGFIILPVIYTAILPALSTPKDRADFQISFLEEKTPSPMTTRAFAYLGSQREFVYARQLIEALQIFDPKNEIRENDQKQLTQSLPKILRIHRRIMTDPSHYFELLMLPAINRFEERIEILKRELLQNSSNRALFLELSRRKRRFEWNHTEIQLEKRFFHEVLQDRLLNISRYLFTDVKSSELRNLIDLSDPDALLSNLLLSLELELYEYTVWSDPSTPFQLSVDQVLLSWNTLSSNEQSIFKMKTAEHPQLEQALWRAAIRYGRIEMMELILSQQSKDHILKRQLFNIRYAGNYAEISNNSLMYRVQESHGGGWTRVSATKISQREMLLNAFKTSVPSLKIDPDDFIYLQFLVSTQLVDQENRVALLKPLTQEEFTSIWQMGTNEDYLNYRKENDLMLLTGALARPSGGLEVRQLAQLKSYFYEPSKEVESKCQELLERLAKPEK